MAVITKPKMPDDRIVPINPKTGEWSQAWLDYFRRQSEYIASLEARLVAGGL